MNEEQQQEQKGKSASTESVVFEVEQGARLSTGAPSLLALANGKLLAAFDLTGPDVKSLTGKKGHDLKRNRWVQGRVMQSADGGQTWTLSATFPFRRASLFRDGGDVYLLGELSGKLCLMRSPDGGGSWSAPMDLTADLDLWTSPVRLLDDGQSWYFPCQQPAADRMAHVIFKAPRGASLMNRKAWTTGPAGAPLADWTVEAPAVGAGVPSPGTAVAWHDLQLLHIADASHPWHQPGRLHLLGAVRSGRQHWSACLAVEAETLATTAQTVNDIPWIWFPLPGGHDKFDLSYDEPSRLHWQTGAIGQPGVPLGRDVATEPGRRRLGLWSSANLLDWTFAGTLTSGGEGAAGIRTEPSAAVHGADLFTACRAGGEHSRNARETTRILCIKTPHFRTLPPV